MRVCVCVFTVRKREAEDDRPVEPFIRGPGGLRCLSEPG